MTTRLSDTIAKRAVVALLRSLGANEIIVRTAVSTAQDRRGLGLDQFDIAETRLANVLIRQTGDKPLKLEIVVAATEVETKLGVTEEDSGDTLRNLAGISWCDHLLRVTSVVPELSAGHAFLYRISAEA